MESKEIQNQLSMNYEELVKYLQNKYGLAPCSYFYKDNCKSVNPKVRRASTDGLCCHHVKEDDGYLLNKTETAKLQPFLWQQPEYLVYCNILEHLILHLKITQKSSIPSTGFTLICKQLNDYYEGHPTNEQYLIKEYSLIENNYNDYIKILKLYKECPSTKDEDYIYLCSGIAVEYSKKVLKDLKLSYSDFLRAKGMGIKDTKNRRIKKIEQNKISNILGKYKIDLLDLFRLYSN